MISYTKNLIRTPDLGNCCVLEYMGSCRISVIHSVIDLGSYPELPSPIGLTSGLAKRIGIPKARQNLRSYCNPLRPLLDTFFLFGPYGLLYYT